MGFGKGAVRGESGGGHCEEEGDREVKVCQTVHDGNYET